jgi:hypothetical protein
MTKKGKKTHGESFPATFKVSGGRLWKRKEEGVPGWTSEDDQFQILCGKGYVVLVSFEHDPVPGDDCEFWRKRFNTPAEAAEYAEQM